MLYPTAFNRAFLFLILCICYPFIVNAQQVTIKGIIIDDSSKNPLSFVSIVHNNMGTVSNELGQFVIAVSGYPAKLNISYVGYEPRIILLQSSDDSIVISLSAANSVLPEIVIGKNEALNLVINASHNAIPYAQTNYTGKGYLRQFTKESEVYTAFQEVFFDGNWHPFTMESWHPTEARFASKEKTTFDFSNFSFLSFIAAAYISNNYIRFPIAKKPDSLYNFSIERYITYQDSDDVAVVKCDPKPGYKKGIFAGYIYIDTGTFQILQLEGLILNLSFNLNGPLRVKDADIKINTRFKKKNQQETILDFSELQFTARTNFGFITAKKILYSSKIIMYEYQTPVNITSLKQINPETSDILTIKSTAYNPEYWVDNPIVKRTPSEDKAIQELEKEKKVSNFLK